MLRPQHQRPGLGLTAAGSTFPNIGKHYVTASMEKPDAKLNSSGPHTGRKALTDPTCKQQSPRRGEIWGERHMTLQTSLLCQTSQPDRTARTHNGCIYNQQSWWGNGEGARATSPPAPHHHTVHSTVNAFKKKERERIHTTRGYVTQFHAYVFILREAPGAFHLPPRVPAVGVPPSELGEVCAG